MLSSRQTKKGEKDEEKIKSMRKNVRRLRPELWRQKNWLLHHDRAPPHTLFFSRTFFYQK
jgi:hypothetical protein